MRRGEAAGAPGPPARRACPASAAMECVQVPPRQPGSAAEGDRRRRLLLPPPGPQKEEETLGGFEPWAASQAGEDAAGGPMEVRLQERLGLALLSHLDAEILPSKPSSPASGNAPSGEMVDHATVSSAKRDLEEPEGLDLGEERLQGKETSLVVSHPLQEALSANEDASGNPHLAAERRNLPEMAAAARGCPGGNEKSLQQAPLSPSQEKLASPPSNNCSLDSEAPSSGGDQPVEASPPSEDGKLKHGAKRVTFPSDEDIVSGSLEPKDPWRHAQNVTVEEIIIAYKQACQKLNCKQIPKLLKQIQEFKDLSPRIDCLDLKGEKLDYKACEALEEIFKRVQFKMVDLEQTNLDEDGASALFDMIEYYESATHLNISFNKHIGTRGWQAAAHMMRKTNCLQYLDARNTPLLDHSAPFVARALRISSTLVVLHLENAGLSGRPLMLLATALKMNMNLRELYLADNKLNGLQDSAQLGNLLKFNCYIHILDLRNNHILDSGLAYICEGLKEQRKGLITLVLWNNQLTHTGMAYMGMTLSHMQSLETLNLGHNPIGNEGVRNLKNGLIGNRSVLRLGLASTKLTCEGAVAVAEFIAESPRLLRLDLRENEIKTGGLMALSLALKVNHSLLRLDLDREPKKESVKSFIETQKALLAEIQNGCKRNFILAKEKEEKEQKLQQSASMPEITITEPIEEGPVENSQGDGTAATPEGDEVGETLVSKENRHTDKAINSDKDGVIYSDSDTDDEVDTGLETKDLGKSQKQNDSVHVDNVPQSFLSPEKTRDALSSEDRTAPSNMTEETKCEPKGGGSIGTIPGAQAHANTQENERRISVSSPGRGHKIFVVTRVENLPEETAENTTWLKENISNLQGNAVKQSNLIAQTLPMKTEFLDLQTNGTVSKLAANLENAPSAGTPGSVSEKMNSGPCENTVHETPLPNGLKTEFIHALPDTSLSCDGKMGSCAVEHELNCSKNEKELEELLLEASQETGQEPL
ncbi:protein phosphatase 1 regulatory subunit 37 isoform X1 [Dermochelys coriacea]|uniref:protein phosphatase 1 regulatory subunit 37 isoform X1 n=1 Tax=Dermochelys coriacea TaxID=27794 RepID=UPI0018E70CF0|nr:protein phosphatase 1 regulatory subunit 37 isoform X1 [Dermochelys coriacea]XP_043357631.1 protein phosphatase 1 regulatory subunit 37 isoform X1 [Dermochelys coriacea]